MMSTIKFGLAKKSIEQAKDQIDDRAEAMKRRLQKLQVDKNSKARGQVQ